MVITVEYENNDDHRKIRNPSGIVTVAAACKPLVSPV